MQSTPNVHNRTGIKESNQRRGTLTRRVIHIRPRPIQTTIKDRVKVPAQDRWRIRVHNIQNIVEKLVPRRVPVGGIETSDTEVTSAKEKEQCRRRPFASQKEATKVSLGLYKMAQPQERGEQVKAKTEKPDERNQSQASALETQCTSCKQTTSGGFGRHLKNCSRPACLLPSRKPLTLIKINDRAISRRKRALMNAWQGDPTLPRQA